MPMVGFFLKARKKSKPGINYVLSLVYLVWWAPSNSKIHILSQGAIFGDFLFVTLSFGGHGGFLKTQNFQKM